MTKYGVGRLVSRGKWKPFKTFFSVFYVFGTLINLILITITLKWIVPFNIRGKNKF